MLRMLAIRDFVIVDTLELEFGPGFTVFSGETGAGKSILIDALALALGERADASVIRDGQTRAEIHAEFASNPAANAWLAEHDFGNDDHDGSILLRRVVDGGGRARAWVNGAPVTLTQLRELGELLVDIHGQHAHQALLRGDAQRQLLDAQANITAEVRALGEAYRAWQKITTQRRELENNTRNLEQEREHVQWQVDELSRLALQPGEWDSIQQEHQRLAHAASLIEGAQAAVDGLSEADGSVLEQIGSILQRLRHLAAIDSALMPVVEALEPAAIQTQEAVHTLNGYLARLELDPQRLSEVETRLDAIHSTARKFRLPPNDLPAALSRFAEQLGTLQGATDLDGLRQQEAAAEQAYRKRAATISAARTRTAKALANAVSEGMQSLSMSGGKFDIELRPAEPGAGGLEQVEFLVAGHPGAALRPLAKVASGGELARISLAISVIASTATTVPTLIFDEVDSGIGGAVAEVVGRLLRQLGSIRQVLCVTHLPQVAAQGQNHFAVSKEQVDGKTVSRISPLNSNARVDEIARMLGGIDITATTRKHARELIALAG